MQDRGIISKSISIFGDAHSNGNTSETARCNCKWKIQDGGLHSLNAYISACTWHSNAIKTATPMFSGSSYAMGVVSMLYDQTDRNRKWEVHGQTHIENMFISACTQVNNEMPAVACMLSGSSNITRLWRHVHTTKPEVGYSRWWPLSSWGTGITVNKQ